MHFSHQNLIDGVDYVRSNVLMNVLLFDENSYRLTLIRRNFGDGKWYRRKGCTGARNEVLVCEWNFRVCESAYANPRVFCWELIQLFDKTWCQSEKILKMGFQCFRRLQKVLLAFFFAIDNKSLVCEVNFN